MRTLGGLLDRGLRTRPDDIAIQTLREGVTFNHIELVSNGLAAELRHEFRIGEGDRVAFLAEKAIEIVIGAIATWKLGAIYAPLDVASPPTRTGAILRKLEPSLLISSESTLARVGGLWTDIPRMSYEHIRTAKYRVRHRPPLRMHEHAAAIIMHTSGSTGAPKGVVLSHHSVISYFESHNDLVAHDMRSRSMNTGPFHFDVSIQDTMQPLYYGGSVVFNSDIYVSAVFINLLKMLQATHLTAICSLLDLVSKDFASVMTMRDSPLQVLVAGGEVCNPELFNLWLTAVPGLKAFNGYGPAECNSLCTAYKIIERDMCRREPYPIGYPFRGMEAVLLDPDGRVIIEEEATGILAMAGPQLMTEYWRDTDQTREAIRFIGLKRFYVTGDMCRRDQAGCYHFVGRQDAEVKLRGRRINLNEVRNAVLAHQQVRFVCVRVRQYDQGPAIVAYVYADEGRGFNLDALERILSDRLPPYMIPRHVYIATTIPKTSSAKIDEIAAMDLLNRAVSDDPQERYIWADDVPVAPI